MNSVLTPSSLVLPLALLLFARGCEPAPEEEAGDPAPVSNLRVEVVTNDPAGPDQIDFGDVLRGDTPERTIEIRNLGPGTLSIGDISYTTSLGLRLDLPEFPVLLDEGESWTVNATFVPLDWNLVLINQIIVTTGDQAQPEISIPVRAFTRTAQLQYPVSRLEFGEVEDGCEVVLETSVFNQGLSPLVIEAIRFDEGDYWTVEGLAPGDVLEAGGTIDFSVRYVSYVAPNDPTTPFSSEYDQLTLLDATTGLLYGGLVLSGDPFPSDGDGVCD